MFAITALPLVLLFVILFLVVAVLSARWFRRTHRLGEYGRIYPFRTTSPLTGPTNDPADGWVEMKDGDGHRLMLHLSLQPDGITPQEILGATYRLNDGSFGDLTALMHERITGWHQKFPKAAVGKDIDDGIEMVAKMALEGSLWELLCERCDAFKGRMFSFLVHARFRHVGEHELELLKSQRA